MNDVNNKLKCLLKEIKGGTYGTKHKAHLILKITDLINLTEDTDKDLIEDVPFVAFGNEEFENTMAAEDSYLCERCGKTHEIKFGTTNGVENKIMGFVDCGGDSYLATLGGRRVKRLIP